MSNDRLVSWTDADGWHEETVNVARARLGELRAAFDAMTAPIRAAIVALRVKCPTCRCHIVAGDPCGCCAEPELHEDLDP